MIKPLFSAGLWLLGSSGLGAMLWIIPRDHEWSYFLIQHRWKPFAEVMRRSIFEELIWGMNDPIVILLGLSLILYLMSYLENTPQWLRRQRPLLSYLSLTTLVAGLALIHMVKWIIGRARPDSVIYHGKAYSAWYQLGAHVQEQQTFYSSFPSGHTAMACSLMALAYLLAGDSHASKSRKLIGFSFGALVLGYSLAMVVARTMAKAHWISDGLGSIVMVWMALHFSYFSILKVPQQLDYLRIENKLPDVPFFWEMKLAFYILFSALGLVGIWIGLRTVISGNMVWWTLLLFMGVPVAIFSTRRAIALSRKIDQLHILSL